MIRRVTIRRRPVTGAIANLHPVAARVLAARGLSAEPDYQLSGLLPPEMGGLDRAGKILGDAVRANHRILVVGDFDTDGATGTALAVRALRAMGAADVHWRVPDRFRHGYGLSPELVGDIRELAPDVLLTVDQGVSSVAGVAAANALGIRVVVTDHHLPGPELPAAEAIVNPNLPGDPFPSKALAGVGVMFYMLAAVRKYLRDTGWFNRRPEPRLDRWLDLVSLGTVADLVKLDENNRCLVWQGIRRIRKGACVPGIEALLHVAGRNTRELCAADMGFAVAPRLNAAGRLEDMGIGIRCLLADDEREARALAEQLDRINRERQVIQAGMQTEAEAQVEQWMEKLDRDLKGLCVFDEHWHQGVVGLVASRLKDHLQRPVIALAPAVAGAAELKGSCRSPSSVHMRDLLVAIDNANPGLLDKFGGHARAAGLSLARRHLEAFQTAFAGALESFEFAAEEVMTDGELPGEFIDVGTARVLSDTGPWGQGWPEPLFDGRLRVLERRVVGEHHLKLRVQAPGAAQPLDAIAFRAARLLSDELPDPLHVTYRLEANTWMGSTRAQLNIQHLVSGILD